MCLEFSIDSKVASFLLLLAKYLYKGCLLNTVNSHIMLKRNRLSAHKLTLLKAYKLSSQKYVCVVNKFLRCFTSLQEDAYDRLKRKIVP